MGDYVILDEISINQPKTYQKLVFILDSNMSQNTLSKSYISDQESYRYLNLGSSYGHFSSKLVKNGQHLVKCTFSANVLHMRDLMSTHSKKLSNYKKSKVL